MPACSIQDSDTAPINRMVIPPCMHALQWPISPIVLDYKHLYAPLVWIPIFEWSCQYTTQLFLHWQGIFHTSDLRTNSSSY